MKTSASLIAVLLLFSLTPFLQSGDMGFDSDNSKNISLKKAVCLMLEFEPELNAAEYDTLSSIGDYKIAKSELMPKISLDTTVGYSDRDRTTDGLFRSGDTLLQREIGISLRQLLYDGGQARNNTYAARNGHLAQQLTEKSLIEARVVDLSEVFLEVIRVRRQINLAQRNVDNHAAMRDMLQERAMAGGSRADVGLVQGRLQLAVNTLSTQRLSLDLAQSRFERLTGVRPGDLSYPNIPSLPSNWKSIDISQNFDYLSALEGLEAAEHRFLAAKGRKMPRVYFDAGYTRGTNTLGIEGTDNSASALIVGSWDLFSGGRNKGYECREHYQVGKFEELVRAAKLQSEYRLKTLWQERLGSSNSEDALGEYAAELAQVNSDYEEQFKVGRQELLNILDIQQEHYSATSRLLDAKFDKDQSTYRIMGVQGKLTQKLIGDGCVQDYCSKNPIGECSKICHPDNRVPVTQQCLMAAKFDGNGPIAEVAPSTRQAYYVDKAQFPLECDCEGKCGSCKTAKKIGFKSTKKGGGLFKRFRKTNIHKDPECGPCVQVSPN